MTQINTAAWWYQIPSTFNSKLSDSWRRPSTICGLIRSLLFGWIFALVFSFCILWFVFVPIPSFIWTLWSDSPTLSGAGVMGLLQVTAITLGLIFMFLRNVVKPAINKLVEPLNRKTSKIKPPREPGVVSLWLKSIKEKTCFMVDYK